MRLARGVRLALVGWLSALGLSVLGARAACAQELPRVTVVRPLAIEGLAMDPKVPDLLGLARVRFQGVIAMELSSAGYRLEDRQSAAPSPPPLVLAGVVKEEVCDDVAPSQCRIAIQWELQERSGNVVYRTTTRAVDQQATLHQLQRGLVLGALRSLMGRRRFTSRLGEAEAGVEGAPAGMLGFKRCEREPLELPSASRTALAGLVWVESGSNLAAGAIVSSDGLILSSARALEPGAPLRVRFSAKQVVRARIVASAPDVGVALLRAESAHLESTCLALRDAPLVTGARTFGLGAALAEDRALSLTGAVVEGSLVLGEETWWEVDRRVARAAGAPLLDEQGRLAAVVVAASLDDRAPGRALDVQSALAALGVKPAAITDPRLGSDSSVPSAPLGYVRDPDDAPFELTRGYTFGTGPLAKTVRTAGIVTASVGALGVAATWLHFRGSNDVSSDAHARLVVYNDVSWAILALGAVGVGVSFALPQAHDVVVGHGSAQRRVTFGVAGSGLGLQGEL